LRARASSSQSFLSSPIPAPNLRSANL